MPYFGLAIINSSNRKNLGDTCVAIFSFKFLPFSSLCIICIIMTLCDTLKFILLMLFQNTSGFATYYISCLASSFADGCYIIQRWCSSSLENTGDPKS